METRFTLFLNWLSRFCLYAVVVAVPLFWLPFTIEKWELNKYILFYGLVLLSAVCFIGRAVILKTFMISRTPLDVPLVVLWGIYLVASLASQEQFLSFFGDWSQLGTSFIGFTLLLLFYWLLVQQFITLKQIVRMIVALVLSGGVTGLYFIVRAMPWFNTWLAPIRTWLPPANVVNISNILLGFFLMTIALLAFSFLAIRKQGSGLDWLLGVVAVICLTGFVLVGFKIIWITFAGSLFLLLVFFLTYLEEVRSWWSSVAFLLLVGALVVIFLDISNSWTARLPAEISLAPAPSWSVAKGTLYQGIREFAFGSGPETFAYDYALFRPMSMNSTLAWNIRFSRPFSSALEWLPTTGALGMIALVVIFLLVAGMIVTTWVRQLADIRKKRKLAPLHVSPTKGLYQSPLLFWGLAAGWLVTVITFWLVNFGAVHWMLLCLFTALVVAASASVGRSPLPRVTISLKTTPQYALITSFTFTLLFSLIIVLAIYLGRFFAADMVYARSITKPLPNRITGLQQALALNPQRTFFYSSLAEAFLETAAQIATAGGDPNQVYQTLGLGIQAAKQAAELSPHSVATKEFLANLYAQARVLSPEANGWVKTTLAEAIRLEPTNANLYLNLAEAELVSNHADEAKTALNKAIELKPDLLEAYRHLAAIFEAQKDAGGAITALERGVVYAKQDPNYLVSVGLVHFNRHDKDDYASAEQYFRQALFLNSAHSDALFALATLQEKRGNVAEAIRLFEKVRQLNPTNDTVRRKLNSLIGGSPAGVENGP